ncbi:MAG: 5-oxoprolinase, partial [Proteobacteria bacterium]|nr:5-oxoprolinase [Pseudomonadota bacterium]
MTNPDASTGRWRFWIDRGGTFTDVIGVAPGGERRTLKMLSRSPLYADTAVAGMRRLLGVAEGAPFPAGRVDAIKMGTTVATNALLERRGARTLFVTTRGFADSLAIGDQARPNLFALNIVRPAPLYARVAEADERLDAQGDVVRALDEPGLARALAAARAEGLESVAIAFLHADLNPGHEVRAGELARDAGFRFVSLSSEVSPLPRFLPRAETTVADAYLTPVLRAYVDQVTEAVAGAPLYFMTSGGGLVKAEAFRGRDAVLSGPAGGVVGVGRTAEAAGARAALGFDMGGTSTDVCRSAGPPIRRPEVRVAGARLRSNALDVETVAAGGGSILAFDGLRARVGPASAGADPGPAAYGRGGPATVTDANLVAGRIDPDWFPAIFGPRGDQRLDVRAARARLTELARAMGAESAEAAAEGFLAVAVEETAAAVRRISTERGFDPRDHALVAFGGAAGQVACQVADALGVGEVLCPRYASLLSAWGIGQARMRALRQAGIDSPLDAAGLARARSVAEGLEREARGDLRAQGADTGTVERRLLLSYDGADAALPVPLTELADARSAFEAAHRRLFGFTEPTRTVLIASVEVDAEAPQEALPPDAPPEPAEATRAAEGRTLRADSLTGPVEGPRLIARGDTQIWIAEGWRASPDADGLIRLTRSSLRTDGSLDADAPDPITLELFNRRFMSVAE